MSYLLSKRQSPNADGMIQDITKESAGWSYVEFQAYQLIKGNTLGFSTADQEFCIVILAGKISVDIKTAEDLLSFESVGNRMDPFELESDGKHVKPYAVYVTSGDSFKLTADTDSEIAICKAPGKATYPSRLILPDDIEMIQRGRGNNKRYVHNILSDESSSDSLLVVEVFTDEGNTSSYPSHKHDQSNEPHETYLEETYYHRINPKQGFVMQRVYTDDYDHPAGLNETMSAYNQDVVMVPRGYHPMATIAGYNSYYLNVMAGPVKKWRFTWEKDHEWINTDAYAIDTFAKSN